MRPFWPMLSAALRKITVPAERLRWVPISTRAGFWTALLDIDSGLPMGWVDYDPY